MIIIWSYCLFPLFLLCVELIQFCSSTEGGCPDATTTISITDDDPTTTLVATTAEDPTVYVYSLLMSATGRALLFCFCYFFLSSIEYKY